MSKKNLERGAVSVMCLLVVTFGLIVSLSITSLSVSEMSRTQRLSDNFKAMSLAEAGVDYTIGRLQGLNSYSGTGGDVSFAEGSFNTTVTSLGSGQFKVRSVGTLPNGLSKAVDVVLRLSGTGVFPDGAVVSNGSVAFTGNASTDTLGTVLHVASVWANGNIAAGYNVYIDGSAIAAGACSGNLTCYDPSYPHGQSYGPRIVFPTATEIANMTTGWENAAKSGGTRSGLVLSGGTATITGPVYINGNVSLSGSSILNIVGSGTVFINGSLSTTGQSIINNSCNLVTSGTIDLAGKGYYVNSLTATTLTSLSTDSSAAIQVAGNGNGSPMGIIYAVNGGVKVNGNGTVYGGIIAGSTGANSVSAVGGATIYYPPNLYSGNGNLPRRLSVTTWLEE